VTAERPLLVVVSGPPASAKSSVTRELARRLRTAYVLKDTFKEVLYELFGSRDDVEALLDEAAFRMLLRVAEAQIEAGVPFIIESNFDARSDLAEVLELARRHDVRLVQLHFRRETEALLASFAERARSGDRHPGHGDEPEDVEEVRRDLEAGRWEPLDLPGELVEIDPDDESVDVDELAERLARVECPTPRAAGRSCST
jgi:predicted kinase